MSSRFNAVSIGLFAAAAVLGGWPSLAQEAGAPAVQSAPPATVPAPAPPGNMGQNPFNGGIPAGSVSTTPLRLSLADAVARGLKQNLGSLLAEEGVRTAEAQQRLARSGLIPTLNGRASAASQQINLEAYGFAVPPGQSPVVGPFNVFDVRLAAEMPLLDLGAMERNRAGREGVTAARASLADAREQVVLVCATLYLSAATGLERIDAARAQYNAAEALHRRAVNLREAGVVPGIEVLRAEVQVKAQRQRVLFFENEFAKQKLALARAIGVPLGQPLELADRLPFRAPDPIALDDVLKQALLSRPDLLALDAQVRAAEAARSADSRDGLPSVRLSGDIGRIGSTADRLYQTYSVGVGLVVPIFEAGRVKARVAQADAALAELRARRDDLRGRVELDVRSALLDVQSAAERVDVARGALDLAKQTEAQAQDRFGAGVSSNIEVVQAEDTVASATENYLGALFAYNAAKLQLARAAGQGERSYTAVLGLP